MRWLLTYAKLGLVKFAIAIAVERQETIYVLARKAREAMVGMSGR